MTPPPTPWTAERIRAWLAEDTEWPTPGGYHEMLRDLLAAYDRVKGEERQRAAGIVRMRLAYNDQRSVSWHDVQDAAEAIEKEMTDG